MGTHFDTFLDENHKTRVPGAVFCALWPKSSFCKENYRNTGDPGPLECDENIANTVSDAMSPCCGKSTENEGPGLHFGGLWGHFGVTLGTKWAPEVFLFRGQKIDSKNVFATVLGMGGPGGVPLKQTKSRRLETRTQRVA